MARSTNHNACTHVAHAPPGLPTIQYSNPPTTHKPTPPCTPRQKRATTSLLAAALSLAAAAAASDATVEAPRPTVTVLGVPRSVEKELLALNATGKLFECKDSRKTKIAFDKVNDGYCDCPETGADEPGTAACAPQGQFYCRNKGYVGQFIPSSRCVCRRAWVT